MATGSEQGAQIIHVLPSANIRGRSPCSPGVPGFLSLRSEGVGVQKASGAGPCTEGAHAGHVWLRPIDGIINTPPARMVTRADRLALFLLGESLSPQDCHAVYTRIHPSARQPPVCAHTLGNVEGHTGSSFWSRDSCHA